MPKLEEYRQKRDFEKTSEPKPEIERGGGPLVFVIQKHRATRLHYDLRLEVNGVLKSWAVPKGPSLNPADKRLAAMVEDHPIEYASFEGTIPKGEYGAGEVIVWDNGSYSPDEDKKYHFKDREEAENQLSRGLASGKISFHLRGHKLRGSWTLVKVRGREKNWLLIKHQDDFARNDYDVLTEELSVVSGRTLEGVRDGDPSQTERPSIIVQDLASARQTAFPGFIAPMLASIANAPFSNPVWLFEPKLDGYRTIASVRDGKASLYSRRGNNVSDKYSPLLPALSSQPASELVIDGEMVSLDSNGHVSFEALQQYLRAARSSPLGPPLIYYVFDILHLDGYDLKGVPLRIRKEILKSTLRQTGEVRLVEGFEGDGKSVFEAAVKNGLEGAIGKTLESTYQSGRRSRDWLKIKSVQSGDFVVGGYTAGEGNRYGSLGALLVGYFDDKRNLVYAGHVGSGFDGANLSELKSILDKFRTEQCPFSEIPVANARPTWVRPEVVAEVKFSQWTKDGRLRAPVFLKLREDKAAEEAVKPTLVEVPETEDDHSGVDEVQPLIERLAVRKSDFTIDADGSLIELKNIDKELWPETETHRALTKRDFLSYLVSISSYILPHLKDRPLTLSRYPNGILGEHFWQKHWNSPVPEFVKTVGIEDENGKSSEYILCNNLATLLLLGQSADVEFHTWYSRVASIPDIKLDASKPDRVLDFPDFIVLDIDPYIYSGSEKPGEEPEFNRRAFDKACEVALLVREVVHSLSMNAFVKTSGKTGLHVYVPVVRKLEFLATRKAAETIGRYIMQRHPEEVTLDWAVEKRKGKVFIDYNQNVKGKTLASVYSPRPNAEAGVSFPLRWEELGKKYPTDFNLLTVPGLLKRRGDIWSDILNARTDVERTLGL